jgi:hypothetical protein
LIRLNDADASVDPTSSSSLSLLVVVEDAAVVLALVFFRLTTVVDAVVVARAADDGWRKALMEVADPTTTDSKSTVLTAFIVFALERRMDGGKHWWKCRPHNMDG